MQGRRNSRYFFFFISSNGDFYPLIYRLDYTFLSSSHIGYVEDGVERKIPLEISLRGDKELIYSATNEEEGRGNAAAVIQFQAYGAMGMAREEFDNDSASTQFFWLLFESDLTPAGKNLLDGRYSCFGYTVKNADLLKGVREGDIIKSAKIVYGNENLNKK